VQVNGTITATFTWVPDPSLPSDPAPSAVIVTEHCTASGDGYAYTSQPTVSADDGFGDAATTTSQSQNSIAKTSADFRSSAKSGDSFTVTCSPSVTVSGTMCALHASVSYMAVATSAVLKLSGVTSNNGSKNILIGQGITASVDTGNIHQIAWAWTISGDRFAGFVVVYKKPTITDPDPINTGHAVELTPAALTQANVPYFYRSIGGTPSMVEDHTASTITGTVTVANQNARLSPFQVTVTGTVNVYQPAHSITTTLGTLGIYENTDGSFWYEAAGPNIRGINWVGTVTTPAFFVQEEKCGSWFYAQLIQPNISYTLNGTVHSFNKNDHTGLDTSFPYGNSSYLADGTPGVSGDSPGFPIDDTLSRINLKLKAWTWMLYNPPAYDSVSPTTYVPLHEVDWTVGGAAIHDALGWHGVPEGNGIDKTHDGPTSVLPDWMELISAVKF
jgi:hypothetical protein